MKEYLLVGNPNTGKTTFFNFLTSSNEKVGNWHGVTVEEKRRSFDKDSVLVDLPGIYSLTPLSYEEEVAVKYIYNHKDTTVLNICDVNNLSRNLYLTLELLEAGIDTILIVNLMGGKEKFNKEKLENKLGIKILVFNGKNKKEIIKQIKIKNKKNNKKLIKLPKNYENLNNFIKKSNIFINFSTEFIIQKINEKDNFFIEYNNLAELKDIFFNMCEENSIENVSKCRYEIIEDLIKENLHENTVGRSKLDKIFLNKYLSIPIFLFLMFLVFYLTFFSVGAYLSSLVKFFVEGIIGKGVSFFIRYLTDVEWIIDLFETALVGGVGSLLCFLPQIALLFMFLHILEDSGYLARIAFVFEDVFYKLGLSGKSVYTLLMGFGCSTSAIMTARNNEDENAKIKTAMITPFMSCSAKLPIYAVIGGAFFGGYNIFIIFGIYILGIIVALLLCYLLEKKILKSKQQSFILEFPNYRMINLKKVLKAISENCKQFLIKVGSLLISMNVIVWIFQNFSFAFKFVGNSSEKSMLRSIGEFLAPVFVPLGFGSYGAVSSLIAGFVAKEIIVSSIAMFNGIKINQNFNEQTMNSILLESSVVSFTPLSAISYMIFCLLYTPCLASISMLSSEIGKKWTFFAVIIQLLTAYVVCFIVYQTLNLISIIGISILLYILVFAIIILSFIKVYKTLKNKKCISCLNCNNCKYK